MNDALRPTWPILETIECAVVVSSTDGLRASPPVNLASAVRAALMAALPPGFGVHEVRVRINMLDAYDSKKASGKP